LRNDPISQILEENKGLDSDEEGSVQDQVVKKKKKVEIPNFFAKTHDKDDPNVIDPQELYN
jgi:hypothetical protein